MCDSGTPLYDALKERAARGKLRFHMPGHKGRDVYGSGLLRAMELDFTELRGTGNLYDGTAPIADAERLAAKAWRVPRAFFTTCGATSGIFAAIYLSTRGKKKIIIDRGCHKSVYHAAALMDLNPVYVYPDRIEGFNINGAVSPDKLEKLLTENPDAGAVVLTCPTYYGVMSDIKVIAKLTRRYGIPLIVDEAHGAHLPFSDGFSSAVALGADIAVCSMHKTLPALGQAAMVLTNEDISPLDARRALALFSTSSPSYDIMATMDLARDYMQNTGRAVCKTLSEKISRIRRGINSSGIFKTLDIPAIDPLRLCVNTAGAGLTGYKAAEILEDEFDIVCETADLLNVLFIITAADSNNDIERLNSGLCALRKYAGGAPVTPPDFPQGAKAALTPYDALNKAGTTIPLRESAGYISLNNLCPYPPGIPVVAMGEVIYPEHIAYLLLCGFSPEEQISVISLN